MKHKTGKGPAREPDWALLNEKAVTVEIDFSAIVKKDKKAFQTEGLPKGKLLERYQSDISEAAISALMRLWPGREIKRSMLTESSIITNIASVEEKTLFMRFDYSLPDKPNLKIKIVAESADQPKILEEIMKIKKSYEG